MHTSASAVRRLSAGSALAIVLAFPLRAEEPFAPPVPGEAHGMTGADRATAMRVYRSHYQNMLDVYGPLRLTGVDWKDPSKPKSCEIKLTLPETGYRPGAFAEGLPVRRAQPLVFNQFQQQITGGLSLCGRVPDGMAFTVKTWTELQDSARELLLRNSGTTFCLKDSDCYGVEINDACGAHAPFTSFGSEATDAVFHVAFRKFQPSLLTMAAQQVVGAMGQLDKKHPDHGTPGGSGQCPMKHWEERPIEGRCVLNACRAKTP